MAALLAWRACWHTFQKADGVLAVLLGFWVELDVPLSTEGVALAWSRWRSSRLLFHETLLLLLSELSHRCESLRNCRVFQRSAHLWKQGVKAIVIAVGEIGLFKGLYIFSVIGLLALIVGLAIHVISVMLFIVVRSWNREHVLLEPPRRGSPLGRTRIGLLTTSTASQVVLSEDTAATHLGKLDLQGVWHPFEVVLVPHRGEHTKLLTVIKPRKRQKHHTPQVVADGSLRWRLLQPGEILFSPDDILLHWLLGLSPNIGAVKGSEKQLVDLHRHFCSYVFFQRLDEQFHTYICRLATFSNCSQLFMWQLADSFICRSCQSSTQVDRRGSLGVLAISSVEKVPSSFRVLLKGSHISRKLRYTISVADNFREAIRGHAVETFREKDLSKQVVASQPLRNDRHRRGRAQRNSSGS